MKVEILQTDFAGHTDVTTHVEINGQIYRESTGVMTSSRLCDTKGLNLEILESVKRHIITIQNNILLHEKTA